MSSSRRRSAVWFWLLALGAASLAVEVSAGSDRIGAAIWGVALMLGGLLVAFGLDEAFDLFSPAAFVGMSLAVLYGGALALHAGMDSIAVFAGLGLVDFAYFSRAGLVTFLCLLGFAVGYRLRGRTATRPGSRWYDLSEGMQRRWWMVSFLSGAATIPVRIAYNAYFQTQTELQSPLFYSVVGFFENGLWIGLGLSLSKAVRHRRDASGTLFWRLAAACNTVTAVAFGALSGSKTLVLLPFMIGALVWNYRVKRVSRGGAFALVLAGITSALLLFPFNEAYRSVQYRNESMYRQGVGVAIRDIAEAVSVVTDMDASTVWETTLDYAGGRLANVAVVANILRYQDSGGSAHWGESYLRIIYALVPRPLWMDKPSLTIGQEFAVELGYSEPEIVRLGRAVAVSSVGITMVGELVYNFGPFLAPLGMVLIGFGYRRMYEMLREPLAERRAGAIALYAFLWYAVVYTAHETNLAAVVAGAAKYAAFAWVILLALGLGRRARTSAARATTAHPGRLPV